MTDETSPHPSEALDEDSAPEAFPVLFALPEVRDDPCVVAVYQLVNKYAFLALKTYWNEEFHAFGELKNGRAVVTANIAASDDYLPWLSCPLDEMFLPEPEADGTRKPDEGPQYYQALAEDFERIARELRALECASRKIRWRDE